MPCRRGEWTIPLVPLDHCPAGPLRGGKYGLFDGGTLVPFLLRCTGSVEPGRSDTIVSHVDLLASFGSLVAAAAPDSLDMLPALLGKSAEGRRELVTVSILAKTLIRHGDRVCIPPHQGPAVSATTGNELGNSPETQLHDLSRDIGQIRTLAAERPELAESMCARLAEIRQKPTRL